METKDKIVRRDARGRWLPGSLVNPAGRPKKTGRHISNLIKAAFDEKVDVIIGRAVTRLERKQIMANALAEFISTGRITLGDTLDEDGNVVKGSKFKFTAENYMKHLLMVLRYVEPPDTIVNLKGGVNGLICDMKIEKPKTEDLTEQTNED